jgi:hypothetical protein
MKPILPEALTECARLSSLGTAVSKIAALLGVSEQIAESWCNLPEVQKQAKCLSDRAKRDERRRQNGILRASQRDPARKALERERRQLEKEVYEEESRTVAALMEEATANAHRVQRACEREAAQRNKADERIAEQRDADRRLADWKQQQFGASSAPPIIIEAERSN